MTSKSAGQLRLENTNFLNSREKYKPTSQILRYTCSLTQMSNRMEMTQFIKARKVF